MQVQRFFICCRLARSQKLLSFCKKCDDDSFTTKDRADKHSDLNYSHLPVVTFLSKTSAYWDDHRISFLLHHRNL